MRYQFFICKPLNNWDALVSRVLREYLVGGECRIDRQDVFSPFDVARLIELLRVASGEAAGFAPSFKFRQVHGLQLVAIRTEYRKAQEVADALMKCLNGNDLFLFDGEMDCRTGIGKGERTRFVVAKLAYLRHKIAIFKEFSATSGWSWNANASVYKLGECHYYYNTGQSNRWAIIDTAISMTQGDIKRGATNLYRLLSERANGHGETVYCENGYFAVDNKQEGYLLRFVLEGCGKTPQWMAWMENGNVKVEILHRMGIYRTRRVLSALGQGEEEYARSRLYFNELFTTRGEWRNPADRFVDSYKMSVWLKKHNLDIIYGRHPNRCCGAFCFYVCDEPNLGWDSWRTCSRFLIPEMVAAPLLALIEDTIPYYYEYYYDRIHVRKEEAAHILERLKEVRQQIIDDPSAHSLGKIPERLLWSSFASPPNPDINQIKSEAKIREEHGKVLFERRFEVVALLDFFARWLEDQRYAPGIVFDGFYVEGP